MRFGGRPLRRRQAARQIGRQIARDIAREKTGRYSRRNTQRHVGTGGREVGNDPIIRARR